ncbi:MAG: hypothetical protein ACPGL0_10310 [Limisphaerales bacterium]
MITILNCPQPDCDASWDSLSEGDNAYTRFCSSCFKKVLLAKDDKTKEDYIQSGVLVAAPSRNL